MDKIPDRKLPEIAAVKLTLLLFKHGRKPDLPTRLPAWAGTFSEELSRGTPGLRNVSLLIEYLLKVSEHVSVDALTEFLAPMGEEAKEIPMTEAQRLREEGRREGEREGEARGRRRQQLETARKALGKGLSPADVAELTELPIEEILKLSH